MDLAPTQGVIEDQNHALQATNTKLTLRVRELERDGKRLDLIAEHLLIIHPPEPSEDEFDGLWVVCAYELPNKVDCLSKGEVLCQAIDSATAKAEGE